MTIKPAQKKDFKHIQRVADKVWPATFGPLMPEEILHYLMDLMYSTASLTRQIDEENINYLIIEEKGEIVGYSSYELNYQASAKLMVHRIYFLPEMQGRGYGTKVLNHLYALGQEKKQQGLTLKVLHSNEKAYQYYLKYGFKKTGEDYNHIGNNYPPFLDYVLEKKIQPKCDE